MKGQDKYRIDSVFFCFIIYFLFNFLFLLFAISFENVLVEGRYFTFDKFSLIEIFIYQSLSLIFIFLFYLYFKNKIKVEAGEIKKYGNKVGWFLFFIQILLIFFSYKYGYGTVGLKREESTTPYLLYMFLNFFPIEYFVFIMSSRLKSNKFFYLNLIICIISAVYRGWLSAIFIGFFIYLIRSGGMYLKQFVRYLVTLIICLSLLPFFVEVKWAIRSGDGIDIVEAYKSDNIKESLNYILSRMQSLGQLEVINRDKIFYQLSYNNGEIKPFYQDGIIQDIIARRLSQEVKEPLMAITARYSFGATQSNLNTGIIGWIIVLGESSVFFILYIMMSLYIIYLLIYKFGTKFENQVLGIFSIIFLFHGFIPFFFWFALYLVIVSFCSKVKQFEYFFYR